MESMLQLRKDFKAEGVNVSVNDLIIKAVAVALSRCPEMNCVWQGDQVSPVDNGRFPLDMWVTLVRKGVHEI